MTSNIDRRAFLRITGGTAVGLPALLAACGTAAQAPSSAPAAAGSARPASASGAASAAASAKPKLQLPTYVAPQGPKPDFPGNDVGLQPAFNTYPKQLVKTVAQAPGTGADITVTTQTATALPPAMDQNTAWQAVNKALNATLKMNIIPTTDYQAKLAVVMAGNNLPDMMYLDQNLTIDQLPTFLKSSYSDITPYVGGDAVKDYANLASIPTAAWRQSIVDGAIYGIPVPRPFQFGVFINQTMFDAAGVGQPKDADDFKRILKELTKPQQNQYGIANLAPAYGVLNPQNGKGEVPQLAMFGAPNNWKVDASGKFTKDWETEEFKAALGYVRDLYAMGVFFPDPTLTQTTLRTNFVAGKVGVVSTGWGNYPAAFWDTMAKAKPPMKVRTLRPFSADGKSTPQWHASNNFNGLTVIKKGSADRVKELLRVLNYFGAPFGSEEFHLLNYGVKDVDHTIDDKGNPVLTQKGTAEMNIYSAFRYILRPMDVLFDPNDPNFAPAAYDDAKAMVANLVNDPSLGLDSPTDRAKGQALQRKLTDGVGDIVAGRSSIGSLDQLVRDWRSGGGNQMRTEFEQAYAASKK